MDRIELGKQLKQAREAANLSGYAVAKQAILKGLSLTNNQIADIEKAKRNYSIDTLLTYAGIVGIKLIIKGGK